MTGKNQTAQPASLEKHDGGTVPLPPKVDALQARHGNGAVTQSALTGANAPPAAGPHGRSLPSGVRSSMEVAFGRSFSDVRVSEGERVRPGQLALTEGRNIDFAPGRFRPETSAGRFLLAHELTHVVQQQNGGGAAALAKSVSSGAPTRPDLEHEANDVAARVAGGGGQVQVLGRVSPGEPVTLAYEAREHILAAWKDYKGWVRMDPFYIPWAFTVTMADLFHSIDEARKIAKSDPEQFEAVLSLQVALPVPGRKPSDGKNAKAEPASIASEEPNEELAINKKIGTDKKRYHPKLKEAEGKIDDLLLVAAVDPGQFRGRPPKGGRRKTEKDYSKKIAETIKARYFELAKDNIGHYLNPERGDLGRSTLEKIERGKATDEHGKKLHPNLANTYREFHEQAIEEAVKKGKEGEDLNDALIIEGWAAHFLSDAFAGGHLRTVRRDAADYWDKKLPFFYTNMIGYLSEKVTRELRTHWYVRAVYHSEKSLLPSVREEIKKKFKEFPEIGGGQALAALPSHDYDNYRGVRVIVNGQPMRLMGDTRLDKATMKMAKEAICLSRGEVTQAYGMGIQGKAAPEVEKALKKEGLYAGEHLIPIVAPDEGLDEADKSLQWENRTLDEMLANTNFQLAVMRFLDLKADDFESAIAQMGSFKRNALKNTILKEMKEDPLGLLKRIIEWKPTIGTEVDDLYGASKADLRQPAAAGLPAPRQP